MASSLQIIGTYPAVFAAIVFVVFYFTFRNETVSIEKNELKLSLCPTRLAEQSPLVVCCGISYGG